MAGVNRGRRKGPSAPDPDLQFLEARRLMDAGEIHAAMEVAGFAVRADMRRPEGYLILGELNLMNGDLVEARRSFAAAARRAKGETRCEALAGLARVALLAGEYDDAVAAYREALRADDTDPFNLRPAYVEALLHAGDLARARTEVRRCDDAVDVRVLRALIRYLDGDEESTVTELRRAFLGNVFLAAAWAGEKPPQGLRPAVEEAGPEYAHDVAERLKPLLDAACGFTAMRDAVARAPSVRRERQKLVEHALRLQAEPDPARRSAVKRAVDALRDPEAIAAGSRSVLAEARGQPGPGSAGSFEV